MSQDLKINEVADRLKFRLLPNEVRGFILRAGTPVVYSVLPASELPAKGTLVFLHGVGSNASRWEEFVERTPLKQSWDLVRIDLRGHASSETRQAGTLEAHSADLEAILDALNVPQAVMVGHSLGAHIAMQFAHMYPDRAKALVLVDPLVDEALTEVAIKKRAWRPYLKVISSLARLFNRLGIKRQLPYYSLRAHDQVAREMLSQGGDQLQAFIKEYSSPFKDLGHIHTADYTRDLIEISRVSADISRFPRPVLVVAATSGKITSPEKVRAWTQRLKHGHMDMVECIHWPFTECPDDISRVIQNWISAL